MWVALRNALNGKILLRGYYNAVAQEQVSDLKQTGFGFTALVPLEENIRIFQMNLDKHKDDEKLHQGFYNLIWEYNLTVKEILQVLRLSVNSEYRSDRLIDYMISNVNKLKHEAKGSDLVELVKHLKLIPGLSSLLSQFEAKIISHLDQFGPYERIGLLKSFEFSGHSLDKIHESILEIIPVLNTNTYTYLLNAVCDMPSIRNKFIRKLKSRAKAISKDPIEGNHLVLMIRGFCKLKSFEFIFRFYRDRILGSSLTNNQLVMIIYYLGSNNIGDDLFWEIVSKRAARSINYLSEGELSLFAYGLHYTDTLSDRIFSKLEKRLLLIKEFQIRSAEKLITALSDYSDSPVYSSLKATFVQKYPQLSREKALVSIDHFKKASMMDSRLYQILKLLKGR